MKLEEFLQSLADLTMRGGFEEAADFFAFPLVVYAPGQVWIQRDRFEAQQILASRAAAARGVGAISIRVNVDSQTETADGRCDVAARTEYLSETGEVVRFSRQRYFCRAVTGVRGWQIEMVEVLELAFPIATPGSDTHREH